MDRRVDFHPPVQVFSPLTEGLNPSRYSLLAVSMSHWMPNLSVSAP